MSEFAMARACRAFCIAATGLINCDCAAKAGSDPDQYAGCCCMSWEHPVALILQSFGLTVEQAKGLADGSLAVRKKPQPKRTEQAPSRTTLAGEG